MARLPVARRIIAVMVVALWSFFVLLSVATYRLWPEYAAHVYDVLNDIVNVPFGIIIAFYFAAHVVRAWPNKKQEGG